VKPRLGRLLAELTGSGDWQSPGAGSRVAIVNNHGLIPPTRREAGDYVWNRGFSLLLLDRAGIPSHFCKCRPAEDQLLRHETSVRETLSRDPRLAGIVPSARGAADDLIQIQVSRFILGKHFGTLSSRLAVAALEVSLKSILATADMLAERAAFLLPDLLSDVEPIALGPAAAPLLDYLEHLGAPAGDLGRLRRLLEAAGSVPRRVQHGDLWTQNVIRSAGSWCVVDYELFGRVQVPMYDAFHLVRSSTEGRPRGQSGSSTWLDRMARGDRTALTSRRVLSWARARYGLTPAQALGALAYYVVDFATRIHSRRVPWQLSAPYVAEVERLSGALQAGLPLERIFFDV
jgi:hypothetical protein